MARSIAALLLVSLGACHDPEDGDSDGAPEPPPQASLEALLPASASVSAAPYDPIHEDPALEQAAYDGLQGEWEVSGPPGLFGNKGQRVLIRRNTLTLPLEYLDVKRQPHAYELRKTMRLLRVGQAHSFAFDLDHRGDFKPEHPYDADAFSVHASSKGWSRRVSARLSKDGQRLTLALGQPDMTAPPFTASSQVELIELEAVMLTPSWKPGVSRRAPWRDGAGGLPRSSR